MSQEKPKTITCSMMKELVDLLFDNSLDNESVTGDPKSEAFGDKISSSLPEELFNRNDMPKHLLTLCDISGISKNETLKSVIKNEFF